MTLLDELDKWLPGPGAKVSAGLVFALPGLLYTIAPDFLAVLPGLSALHILVLRVGLSLLSSIPPLIALVTFLLLAYHGKIQSMEALTRLEQVNRRLSEETAESQRLLERSRH